MSNYWLTLSLIEDFRDKVAIILEKNKMSYIDEALRQKIGKKILEIKPPSIWYQIGMAVGSALQVQIYTGRIVLVLEMRNNVPAPVTKTVMTMPVSGSAVQAAPSSQNQAGPATAAPAIGTKTAGKTGKIAGKTGVPAPAKKLAAKP